MADNSASNSADYSTTWDFESWSEEDVSVSPGTVFSLLTDKRKRQVLYLLDDHGGTVSIDKLAAQIAEAKNPSASSLPTGDVTERVRTHLYHTDLPKLAEDDFVEYDADDETVSLTRRAEIIRPCLEYAWNLEDDDVESLLTSSKD